MIYILAIIFAVMGLTDLQFDQILKMTDLGFRALGEAMKAVWITLTPALLGYLAYRQAMNRKALDANTEVSAKAFDAANDHNEKIAKAVKISEEVLTRIDAEPKKVLVVGTVESHIVNEKADPVPTTNSKA